MKSIFTLVSILLLTHLLAQCPEGDIDFNSQNDIDQFLQNYPDCREIKGYCSINGLNSEIKNLKGLKNVKYIQYDLDIRFTSIKNLEGLENLKNIGGVFTLWNNNKIVNLTGINNLESIGDYFYLYFNNSLTSVTGLDNLKRIDGDFMIEYNASLNSFSALQNLESIGGRLFINGNKSIISFMGLEKLHTIGEGILVSENDNLISFDGLHNLNIVNNYLLIGGNPNLNSIEALSNIVPNLLNDTYGLALSITDNKSLSNCAIQPVCSLLSEGESVEIYNNATSCNSVNEVKENCNLSNNNSFLNENIEIAIYPNPTTDFININSQEKINKVEIYSISGKLLEIVKNKNAISLEKYKQGSYIIVIYTNKGLIENKILKK